MQSLAHVQRWLSFFVMLQAGSADKASATGSRTHANILEEDDGSAAVELTASSRAGSMSDTMFNGYFSDRNKEEEAWMSADARSCGKVVGP